MRTAILAGGIAVVRSGVGYVEDGDEVLDIVLWRLGYRPDSAWSKKHERYLQSIFQHMCNEAPGGYARTTLQQVFRADREVFLRMVQRDVSMRGAADNTLRMDAAILEAASSYEVGFI